MPECLLNEDSPVIGLDLRVGEREVRTVSSEDCPQPGRTRARTSEGCVTAHTGAQREKWPSILSASGHAGCLVRILQHIKDAGLGTNSLDSAF